METFLLSQKHIMIGPRSRDSIHAAYTAYAFLGKGSNGSTGSISLLSIIHRDSCTHQYCREIDNTTLQVNHCGSRAEVH